MPPGGLTWELATWGRWAARTAAHRLGGRPSWSHGSTPLEFDQSRAIFIHIPKTAGTALLQALGWSIPSHVEWWHHKAAFPHKYAAYWSFAFVRNPWDRLVSAFHFLRQGGLTPRDRAWATAHLAAYPDLDCFVRDGLQRPEILAQFHFRPQAPFVCDRDGRIRVDWLGRYERLADDLKVVGRRLGRPITLPRINTSKHRDYREYFTPETADIVGRVYARDCELFHYHWDPRRTP